MENSIIEVKNDLIDWIENIFDMEILQKIVNLKSGIESSSLISDINSENDIKVDYDEQFAAGMTSDELMENITAHIETIASEKTFSVVSDIQAEYAVKDDFDERFAKGIPHKEMKRRTIEHIRNLPWKE